MTTDDLDDIADSMTTNGLGIDKQRKGVRVFFNSILAKNSAVATRRSWLSPDRRQQPSLLHIPCLDRPITNYLED